MPKRINWWNHLILKRQNWWIPLLLVFTLGAGSMLYVGTSTYSDAPPIADFVDQNGDILISARSITRGQGVFLKYALMEYGSFFGDGGGRGPDFTAQALHLTATALRDYYLNVQGLTLETASFAELAAATALAQRDIKQNHYNPHVKHILLQPAQISALVQLQHFYRDFFGNGHFLPRHYIPDDQDIKDLSAFFFWGAWVCGTLRPDKNYSYTHNWPYDELAGNTATAEVLLWSVAGTLGLIAALGSVLFLYGRYSQLSGWQSKGIEDEAVTTQQTISSYAPTPEQRSTYQFFAAAMLLFVLQVFSGVLTVHEFLGLTRFFGINLSELLPLTVTRSWHLQLALLWITACWIGASLFVLSRPGQPIPSKQGRYINVLFALILVLVVGALISVLIGPLGLAGEHWNLLGHQGWEFVELGKLWQGLLFVVLALWFFILLRAVRLIWHQGDSWMLPKWLLYTVGAIVLLFISGFVATPETNFVIADFWRWAVVHMWVEAFFEVFATIIVAWFMVLMGFVSHKSAARIIYLATLLFLGSGLLGISHNFYWNAKPEATLAIGSVFSTLQVVPLILLTLEAWQFRKTPANSLRRAGLERDNIFGQAEAFLFLIGVNFWNFLGAGVFGFIINLPIVNYYEHGTYLTVNHGHAALMGVYGNLALAAIVFCCRYLIAVDRWNSILIRRAFWSLNAGLMLMVLLDLFPVGFVQFRAVLDHGLWYARSEDFIQSDTFQLLTWSRMIGGLLFVFGGLLPLCWFVLRNVPGRKQP